MVVSFSASGGAAVTTWTLVIFVYYGSGMMTQSSTTGYSSYAECNKAGSNWMKNAKGGLKEYRCVSLKIGADRLMAGTARYPKDR
jgi:hypothetical protein